MTEEDVKKINDSLKPCPFFGSKVTMQASWADNNHSIAIMAITCPTCMAMMGRVTSMFPKDNDIEKNAEDMLSWWNMRVPAEVQK